MANLYTKTGDEGKTSLIGGTRVDKSSLRVNCYGTIDEANSALGMAYSLCCNDYIRETVNRIQRMLFVLAAELASDEKGLEKLKRRITDEDIKFLEGIVDKCTETTGIQRNFVVPGVDDVSSALHVARTVVRRAERQIIELAQTETVADNVKKYVNRLSDAIYALARLEETLVEQRELRKTVEVVVRQCVERIFGKAGGEAADSEPAPAESGLSAGGGEGNMCSLERCRRMALAVERKAKEIGVPMACTVVDAGGNVIMFQRMEGTLLASTDISMNKAYTAAALKMPTEDLGKVSGPGQPLYGIETSNNGRIVLFGGGFPIFEGGVLVGALGISGGTVDEDVLVGRHVMECISKGEI